MRKLDVTRYKQKPSHCAIAACASISNYYNRDIDYEKSQEVAKKKVVKDLSLGLNTGEIGKLLNNLGFRKITVISSNLYFLDYSWSKLKKPSLIKKLEEMKNKYNGDYVEDCEAIYELLIAKRYKNNLIIDYDFGKHIRSSLDAGRPLIFSFNWSMFFRYPKENIKGVTDSIKGESEEHAVVACGYDKNGVDICDSHHQFYKYRLKKFRGGKYRISWENLMTIIGCGDIILADDYKK